MGVRHTNADENLHQRRNELHGWFFFIRANS